MATAALSTRVAFGPDTTNVVPPPFTDYSRWERKPVRLHTPRSSPKLSTIFDLPSHQRSPRLRQHNCGYGHGHVPARGTGVGKLFAVEATRSVTSPAKSKSDAVKVSPPRRRLKTETAAHKILKMQVAAKKKALSLYQSHREELLSTNLALIGAIQDVEESTHATVEELLEKYHKFKGTLGYLKQRSSRDIVEARTELDATREQLNIEIEGLRANVSRATADLRAGRQDLQVLLHYKEKDSPVKLLRIEQLKEQVELLSERNKASVSELEAQVEEERRRSEQHMESVRLALEVKVTEDSIARIQRSVKEKAIQNRIIEKEILIHQKRVEENQAAIKLLKSKIRTLRQAPKELTVQQQPLLHLSKFVKCLPDSELKLDIPLQDTRL